MQYDRWTDPPWESPLDEEGALRAIPTSATMTGMFLEAVVKLHAAALAGRGVASPPRPNAARDRYVAFTPYPLREHCELLLEVARAIHPELSVREGLRRLGRGAPHVLMQSTVGRVVLGSVEGPLAILEAMAKSYMMHMKPGSLVVSSESPTSAVVRLTDVFNFVDSHNVGVFEGTLRWAKVAGTVRIRSHGRASAEFLCAWGAPSSFPPRSPSSPP